MKITMAPMALTINDFCSAYGIQRSHLYIELAAGRIKAVKSGKRTLIRRSDAEAWLAALPVARMGERRP